jgi:glutamine cyclotransferase
MKPKSWQLPRIGRWAAVAAIVCASAAPAEVPGRRLPAPVGTYRVVNVYPHDRASFTQGLEYVNGVLYEGTGLYGRSAIRKVRLQNGEALQHQAMENRYFGEGITVWRDTIVQLTYMNEVGFVYDRKTFKQLRTFKYTGEGWGLTHDGDALIMSNGSATLRFLDPRTFAEVRRVTVRDAGVPVERLNELELVRGEIWANIWQTNRIARISPKSGDVLSWVDLTGLLAEQDSHGVDVLNGIAYDRAADRLFVTGKLWPKLFEIRVVPPMGTGAAKRRPAGQ